MNSSSIEHEGSADGPGQGDPAAHPPYLWAWRISNLTWSGTVDEETATSMAAEYGQAPVPLYRASGAVAAAPEHDEATVERVAQVIADSVRPGWRIDFAAVARDALTAAHADPEETR